MKVLHRSAGGSAIGLLATGAWRRAAVGDEVILLLNQRSVPLLRYQRNLIICHHAAPTLAACPLRPECDRRRSKCDPSISANKRHMHPQQTASYSITSSARRAALATLRGRAPSRS